ncbi:unnamed protein product [Darwinula stevensoni]|uniref:Receptor protein-tyrosine kinase n=1 Tax=Darwinula stevensoni TaxID=69355 RepID=A0A7R9A538_9CRUS|nr:unnamed protein product [Darwinula stevensoni]CAG0891255.1 unnamed protein product [Darwinula stevensoni]
MFHSGECLRFTEKEMTFTIPDGFPTDGVIHQLRVFKDWNETYKVEEFKIKNPSIPPVWIDPSSGVIFARPDFIQRLNRTRDGKQVEVEACINRTCDSMKLHFVAAGVPADCSNGSINEDVCFHEEHAFQVKENLKGVVLGDLRPKVMQTLCPDLNISYYIVSEPNWGVRVSWDGKLETTFELDREDLVKANENQTFVLQVRCFVQNDVPGMEPYTFKHEIQVEVLDEDDNPPELLISDLRPIDLSCHSLKEGDNLKTIMTEVPISDADSVLVNSFQVRMLGDDLGIFNQSSLKIISHNFRTLVEVDLPVGKNMNVNDLEALPKGVYNVSIVVEDTSLHNPHASNKVTFEIHLLSRKEMIKTREEMLEGIREALGAYPISVQVPKNTKGIFRLPINSTARPSWNSSFSLPSSASGVFRITPETGIIYIPDLLDLNVGMEVEMKEVLVQFREHSEPWSIPVNISVRVESSSSPCSHATTRQCASFEDPESCSGECGCFWRQGKNTTNPTNLYSTCSQDLHTCPDGRCDELEQLHPWLCPQDCARTVVGLGHSPGITCDGERGIFHARGVCSCLKDDECSCKDATNEEEEEHLPPECLRTAKGLEYIGHMNRSWSGKLCIVWHHASLLEEVNEDGIMDPIPPENYCRNMKNHDRPWCFVDSLKGIIWEYCNIPRCTGHGPDGNPLLVSKPPIHLLCSCNDKDPSNTAMFYGSDAQPAARRDPFCGPLDASASVDAGGHFVRDAFRETSKESLLIPYDVQPSRWKRKANKRLLAVVAYWTGQGNNGEGESSSYNTSVYPQTISTREPSTVYSSDVAYLVQDSSIFRSISDISTLDPAMAANVINCHLSGPCADPAPLDRSRLPSFLPPGPPLEAIANLRGLTKDSSIFRSISDISTLDPAMAANVINCHPSGPCAAPAPLDRSRLPSFLPPGPLLEGVDKKWEFPRNRLHLETVLGEGEFGRVLKGQALGILPHEPGYRTVAVKMPKNPGNAIEERDLLSEFHLLKDVSHPNVIRVLGIVTQQGGPVMLILEFCKYGCLRSYLRKCVGGEEFEENEAGSGESLTPNDILSIAWQIARGMAYIANMRLVHRDLAARNVLLAEGRQCKISDFGLTRDVYEGDIYMKISKGRVPVKWMAPESLVDGVYTSKSDVWSFGVLLWELTTMGASPYPGVPLENLVSLLESGYRMSRPTSSAPELYSLMKSCWTYKPAERPDFQTLSDKLEELLQSSSEYLEVKQPCASNAMYFLPSSEEPTAEREREVKVEEHEEVDPSNANRLVDESAPLVFAGQQDGPCYDVSSPPIPPCHCGLAMCEYGDADEAECFVRCHENYPNEFVVGVCHISDDNCLCYCSETSTLPEDCPGEFSH